MIKALGFSPHEELASSEAVSSDEQTNEGKKRSRQSVAPAPSKWMGIAPTNRKPRPLATGDASVAINRFRGIQVDVPIDTKPSHKFLLWPTSRFKSIFDAMQILILVYIAIVVPFRVSFEVPAEGGWYTFELLIDVFFWVDIVLNCITGYYSPSEKSGLVMDLKKIVLRYAKGWMLIDVISSLPVDLIFRINEGRFLCSVSPPCDHDGSEQNARAGQLFRLVKILRLVQLLKLLKVDRFMSMFRSHQMFLVRLERIIPILKQMVILTMLGHWCGCCFYLFSTSTFRTAEEQARMTTGAIKPWIETNFGPEPEKFNVMIRYTTALYWSFATLTSVGYGDISATTTAERICALIEMVFGTIVFGFVVASCVDFIAMINRRSRHEKARFAEVQNYIRHEKVPKGLKTDILMFFKNKPIQFYDTHDIIHTLSPLLQDEVMAHVFAEVRLVLPDIMKEDYFRLKQFYQELRERRIEPGEHITQSGSHATSLFLISSGSCTMLDDDEVTPFKTLKEGAFFGTETLCGQLNYSRSIQAIGQTTVQLWYIPDDRVQVLFNQLEWRKIKDYLLTNYPPGKPQGPGNSTTGPRNWTPGSTPGPHAGLDPECIKRYAESMLAQVDSRLKTFTAKRMEDMEDRVARKLIGRLKEIEERVLQRKRGTPNTGADRKINTGGEEEMELVSLSSQPDGTCGQSPS